MWKKKTKNGDSPQKYKMTNGEYPNTTSLVFSVAYESFQANYCRVFVLGLRFTHNGLGVRKTKSLQYVFCYLLFGMLFFLGVFVFQVFVFRTPQSAVP